MSHVSYMSRVISPIYHESRLIYVMSHVCYMSYVMSPLAADLLYARVFMKKLNYHYYYCCYYYSGIVHGVQQKKTSGSWLPHSENVFYRCVCVFVCVCVKRSILLTNSGKK